LLRGVVPRFLELSIDEYAKRRSIITTVQVRTTNTRVASQPSSRPTRDMTLREKIKASFDFMEQNSVCTKPELLGIRSLHSNRYHVLSVDTLNAYVHNQHYIPNPTDLKANWDSIEVFVQRIWTT
jgi:hypothetical protein